MRSCGHGAQRCCAPTFLWWVFAAVVAGGFVFPAAGLAAQRKPVLAADSAAASLLLPRDVFAAVDERAEQRDVVAGFKRSDLFDGRVALAAAGRFLTAQQLTDGTGYDYQPDWSPDGKRVVYVSYLHDAMELFKLDLESGSPRRSRKIRRVDVEPRWSPDGTRIVYVSTAYHGRFHIFTMNFKNDGTPDRITRLTEETKSTLPRYYYAEYDTEIHPTWSRDGKEILFVSNRGHIYGTGGFWRMRAEPGAEAREIHYEETTWKARPDFSPDGTKILYSSYLGRQWHQLWVMPANGGDAFPISYGDWDETYARWSPDGKRIAFISNRNGNTELWVQEFPGGGQRRIDATERKFLRPHGRIEIEVVGGDGKPTPARVSVTDATGKFFAPRDAWISGADGFDRERKCV